MQRELRRQRSESVESREGQPSEKKQRTTKDFATGQGLGLQDKDKDRARIDSPNPEDPSSSGNKAKTALENSTPNSDRASSVREVEANSPISQDDNFQDVSFMASDGTVLFHGVKEEYQDGIPDVAPHHQDNLSDPRIRGRAFEVEDPTDRYNCHGWSLTGRKDTWVMPEAGEIHPVQKVLNHPAFQFQHVQEMSQARPNDLVVYRDENNEISHSGRVKESDTNGNVWVRSKWGDQALTDHVFDAMLPEYRHSNGNIHVEIWHTDHSSQGFLSEGS